MSNIIPYAPRLLNGETIQTVDGRDLHTFLDVSKDYSNWVKQQIRRAHLLQGQDFEVFAQKGENPSGGRPTTEYAFTFEAAKHIAMVSGAPKGHEVRAYFITCEKALQATRADLPSTSWDMLAQMVAMGRQQEQRLLTLEAQRQADLEARLADQQRTIDALTKAGEATALAQHAIDTQPFQTLAEYVYLNNLQRQLPEQYYAEAGLFLTDYCLQRKIPIRKIAVVGKRWESESGYAIGTLQHVLPGWIARRFSQTELTVIPGGA